MRIFGQPTDEQTRCVHWHSELDVVAIKFACCGRFYPCSDCHDEHADHLRETWPRSAGDVPAVLCGVCHRQLTIDAYLTGGDVCPACGAAFNPGCRLHRNRYFDV